MMTLNDWLADLAYTDFPDELFRAGQKTGTRPYATEIEEMLAADGGIGASAVFCVGEQPTVCFIDATTLPQAREYRVEQIRQKVWNQNLASVVLVLAPQEMAAYAVNDRGAEPHVLARADVRPRGHWSAYNNAKGFGFITPDEGGKDVFVHATALEAARIAAISEGDRVSFEVEDDERGRGKKAGRLKLA